jgi:hypothetical protein
MKEEVRRSALARIARELGEGIPLSDKTRFCRCDVCGQFFDSLDLTEVHYHDDSPHDPMTADA